MSFLLTRVLRCTGCTLADNGFFGLIYDLALPCKNNINIANRCCGKIHLWSTAIQRGCTFVAGERQWPRTQGKKIMDKRNAIGSRGCRLPHTRRVGECRGTWSANWTFSRTSPRAEHGRQRTIRRCRVCFPAIRLWDGRARAYDKRNHAWGSRPTVAGASGQTTRGPPRAAGTRRLYVGNVARAALCTNVNARCTSVAPSVGYSPYKRINPSLSIKRLLVYLFWEQFF